MSKRVKERTGGDWWGKGIDEAVVVGAVVSSRIKWRINARPIASITAFDPTKNSF